MKKSLRIAVVLFAGLMLLCLVSVAASATNSDSHTHVPGEEKIDLQPTCTEYGHMYVDCKICGARLADGVIPPTGHTPGEETIDLQATCTENGHMYVNCKSCGTRLADGVIPATGHVEGKETVDLEATCTEYGHTYVPCTKCGTHLADGVIPPTGHVEGKETVDLEATCTEYGHMYVPCTKCGTHLADGVIPPTGHSYENGVCKNCGAADPSVTQPETSAEAGATGAPVTTVDAATTVENTAAGNEPVATISCGSGVISAFSVLAIVSAGVALGKRR